MISFGLAAESCSQPRFHFSSVPGRKFSSRKSAFATSSSSSCCPSRWRRSSVIAFLLRPMTGHHSEARRLLPPPDPHRIALARRLDLDDLGAEVPEQLAAERAREQGAEFEHPQVGQGAVVETRCSAMPCVYNLSRPTVN